MGDEVACSMQGFGGASVSVDGSVGVDVFTGNEVAYVAELLRWNGLFAVGLPRCLYERWNGLLDAGLPRWCLQ